VQAGVRELLVISQDTSAYGVDVKYRPGFYKGKPVKSHITELAEALGDMGVWIRLHYVYPYPHVDKLIPLMADGKILPYLDVPLQHASPSVLKAMKRPANTENTLERIRRWREICPDIVLRSTFITGFPGETERDFEQLLEFIQEAKLDRVGCFTYSAVDGAVANTLPGAVPEEVKEERLDRFMTLQADISTEKLAARIGSTMQVLVDGMGEQGMMMARSYAHAPEIDGCIHIKGAENLKQGDMLEVRVTDSDAYDLYAEIA
jgi:ribosomal protein S12 methylthiotransferase